MKEAIKVEKLSKSYQGRKVLDNLSLSVKENTVFGLLGAKVLKNAVFTRGVQMHTPFDSFGLVSLLDYYTERRVTCCS